MINQIINGIIQNWFIVLLSFLMLMGGTFRAWQLHGWKRVLLGKRFEHRELIYRRGDNSVSWKPTLQSWKIILTGGMSILTIFLLLMLLVLSFVYAHDIQATRDNDFKLCEIFGTTQPTQEQLDLFYNKNSYTYELDLDLKNLDFPINIVSGDNETEKT